MTALFALRVGVCNLTHAKKWGLELDLSARAFRFRHLSRGNLSHITRAFRFRHLSRGNLSHIQGTYILRHIHGCSTPYQEPKKCLSV